jgi:hypothetical protein
MWRWSSTPVARVDAKHVVEAAKQKRLTLQGH